MAATLQLSDLAVRPDFDRAGLNLDFFLCDLKQAKAEFELTGGVPMNVAQSLESHALKLLDAISPPIRAVIADYERWKAAQREGACR